MNCRNLREFHTFSSNFMKMGCGNSYVIILGNIFKSVCILFYIDLSGKKIKLWDCSSIAHDSVAVVNKRHACAVVSPPKVSVTKPVFPAHIYITVVCTLSSFTPNKRVTPNCLCCTCTYGTYRVVTLVTKRLRDVKFSTAAGHPPHRNQNLTNQKRLTCLYTPPPGDSRGVNVI